MVKIFIRNQMTRKESILDENTSLRAAFEQAGIECDRGIITLSGTVIGANELDKTFADFGVTESAVLNVNTKTDNAASIVVVGDAAVIKSAFTYEQIALLEKYAPKALVLTEEDEDSKKTEVFRVGTTKGQGSVTAFGISFGDNKADPATVTVQLPVEKREEYLMDKLGPAAFKLSKLEEGFEAALEKTFAAKAAIETMITRV